MTNANRNLPYPVQDVANEYQAPPATLGRERLSPEDAARSAENIALWKSYLPDDCVAAMIALGWDLSV
jgi:hypothetical protein